MRMEVTVQAGAVAVLNGGMVELVDGTACVRVPLQVMRNIVEVCDMMAEEEDADEGWLDVRDVAHRTGAPLSTVRYWCQSGALRASKLGRRWAVRPSDLESFMEGRE